MEKRKLSVSSTKILSLSILIFGLSVVALHAESQQSDSTATSTSAVTLYGSARQRTHYSLPELDKNTRHIMCHILEQQGNTLNAPSDRKEKKYSDMLKQEIDGTWGVTIPKKLHSTLFFNVCKVTKQSNGSKKIEALKMPYVIEGQAEITLKPRTLHASASKDRVMQLHLLSEGQEYSLDAVPTSVTKQPHLEINETTGRAALIIPQDFSNTEKKETPVIIHVKDSKTQEQYEPAAYIVTVKNAPILAPGGITEE